MVDIHHFSAVWPFPMIIVELLLPVLDVFGMGWVIKRLSQGAAAEMLPKTYDPTYSSWTLRGLLQTRSLQLACKNKAFIIVLQETHCTIADKLVIPNFSLSGSILSRNHGLATFVHEWLEWSLVDQSPEQSETEWLYVDVAGYKIVNIYKPPLSRFTPTTVPTFPHPSLYVGDFNCQHVNWGYNTASPDGGSLDSWTTSNILELLYKPKETASSFSCRWNVSTNPDMASLGQDSRLLDRRVLGKFPRSQHRPSLITPPRFKVPAHSDPVNRWNFRKADWKCLCLFAGESVERLPPPDTPDIERAYQDFCES